MVIGRDCVIGHNVMLHGCIVGDNSLIGMSATLLNGSKIGKGSLVGAGALVTEGKQFEDGRMILGAPAKAMRELTAEQAAGIRNSAEIYVANARRYASGLSCV
jgi:carbonic anhydrase/acetyltransferase-like protein (isoleucine patch superfamily)